MSNNFKSQHIYYAKGVEGQETLFADFNFSEVCISFSIDLTNKRVAYFQTYFDVDVINNETGLVENAIIPKIKISFNLAHNNYGGNDFVISFIDSIVNLNNKTFVPDYTHFLDGNNSYHFHIDNFTISLDEQYEVEKYKIILHSIFIAFQEVE